MENNGVVAITVTYGDRWNILQEVVKPLITNPVINKIIIVDNASKGDIEGESKQLSEKIEVIKLNNNTGSANGFKIGIIQALNYSDCDYIWLLDDDNQPMENALDELLNHYSLLMKENKKDLIALLSLRNDRKEYILASKYGQADKYFPLKNSYLGVHYKDFLKKFTRRFIKKQEKPFNKPPKIVNVPLAPYGGLFFHRRLINIIGLPNEKFYLYSDDYEFSHRIIKNGGKIILVPKSQIRDIDKSWFIKGNQGFLLSLIKSDSEFRIFYSVRNRIYFEMKDLVDNNFIYWVNKQLFFICINIMSIIFRKRKRKELIEKAIIDGTKGILGKAENV